MRPIIPDYTVDYHVTGLMNVDNEHDIVYIHLKIYLTNIRQAIILRFNHILRY